MARMVALDSSGHVVAGGDTENLGTSIDFTVVKLFGASGQDFVPDALTLVRLQIENLTSLSLRNGIEASLLAKLNSAARVLEDSRHTHDKHAINILRALIHDVEAQRGKAISATDADGLISATRKIIDILASS